MRYRVNYLYETTSNDSIDIEDIGNVCLLVNNDLGQNWVLLIKTILGITYILEYGPFYYHKNSDYVYSCFQKIDYSEYKLKKRIDKFINDPKRVITQVQFIDEDEARLLIKSVVEVFDASCE